MVAGHVQVEQDEVDAGLGFQHREHAVERFGFAHLQVGDGIRGGATQCGAEQRMVVGDQQGRHR